MSDILFEQVREMALLLGTEDRRRLIDELTEELNSEPSPEPRKPFKSARGSLSDLGPGPAWEDFVEVRREMAAKFPREESR